METYGVSTQLGGGGDPYWARRAIQITVHRDQWYYVQQDTGRYVYDKWFTTTVPFETWSVLMEIIVNPRNAGGYHCFGPGSVITGYPVWGSYVTETWHEKSGTSIVPWWINAGDYAQHLNFLMRLSLTKGVLTLTEDQFLTALYDYLLTLAQNGVITSSPHPAFQHMDVEQLKRDHPDWQFDDGEWRWTIQGTRDHWWLEITDNRLPGKECPYRLDPRGDPEFFALARKFRAMHRTPVREWISFYVITLLTHMDEKLVGQTEALHAYEAGATPDNPPWIHTTFP